jgi:hypothetical protein
MRVHHILLVATLLASPAAVEPAKAAYPLVPGTGRAITAVGDDFEDESWEYVPNWPKSSNNIDKRTRNPGGYSTNGRWFEAALRGQPDYVSRVDTPPNGLPGSRGALMLRTLQSGIPGSPSGQDQQDDFIANLRSRIGAYVPITYEPSLVTRVYLPPVEQWENRSGSQFAFRAGVRGGDEMEEYWPGIFIQFQSETDSKARTDAAFLVIRADGRGRDIRSIAIEQTGWWTLGMSFTADGRVHYYAKPGVQDLTKDDYLASHVPYNMPVRKFETFFFDCFNRDDGRSWSTPFVIDDTTMYVVRGGEQLEAVAARALAPKRTAAPAAQQQPQRTTTTQNRTAVQPGTTRQN